MSMSNVLIDAKTKARMTAPITNAVIPTKVGIQGSRVKDHGRHCAETDAGGCPAASYFLLLRQKKVTKEKATRRSRPFGVPCAARSRRRLRNSRCALRQSSPTAPSLTALLGDSQRDLHHTACFDLRNHFLLCSRPVHPGSVFAATRTIPFVKVTGSPPLRG